MIPFLKPLLLLLFLIITLSKFSPSHAQNRYCFHCTHETSPLCVEELSENGTGSELITPCTGSNYFSGCVQVMIGYKYPLEVFLFRGCNYGAYLFCFPDFSRTKLEWAVKAPKFVDCINGQILETAAPELIFRKHLREDSGVRIVHFGSTYGHTNGIGFAKMEANDDRYRRNPLTSEFFRNIAKEIEDWKELWSYYAKQVEGLKCFVCSDSTSLSCEGELSRVANSDLAKVCPTAGDGTSAIGCTTMVFQFDYPIASYVFRDCLYPPEFKCFDLGKPYYRDSLSMGPDSSTWNPSQRKSKLVTLLEFVNCINRERMRLGLDENRLVVNSATLPHWSEHTITTQRLHFVAADKFNNADPSSWDLRNREAVAGFIAPQTEVPDEGDYVCYSCDTRNPNKRCDGDPSQEPKIAREKCGKGAYGCALLYEEDGKKTVWFRRECWYRGDLSCLKGRQRPSAALGRKLTTSQSISRRGTKCNARKLLDEGRYLIWNGEKSFRNEQDHESFLECRRRAREPLVGLDQAEWDTLPRTNETLQLGSSSFSSKNKTIHYHYCTLGSLEPCNDRGSRFYENNPYVEPPPPPTTTTTASSSSVSPPTIISIPPTIIPPTATTGVRPWEQDTDDNECEYVDCPQKHHHNAAAGSSRGPDGGLKWIVLGGAISTFWFRA